MLALSIMSASVAQAQPFSESEQAAVILALNRGQKLYAFDQAAWHATDKLMDDARAQGRMDSISARYGGWIVREADPATLEVIFFDKSTDAPKPLYIARMADGGKRVVSAEFAEKGATLLDAATLRMIRARDTASKSLEGQSILRCVDKPYNTAVLPPDTPDGPIPVYWLTPQTDLDHVPFGGHLRIMVSADGKAGAPHPFSKSCMELPTARAKATTTALVATQLLDPLPTEVDVFTMFAAGLPLYIYTPDGRTWSIESSGGQARVRLIPDEPKRH
jgi:hypothetical protein